MGEATRDRNPAIFQGVTDDLNPAWEKGKQVGNTPTPGAGRSEPGDECHAMAESTGILRTGVNVI